jgi:signal transduction histidine kinase
MKRRIILGLFVLSTVLVAVVVYTVVVVARGADRLERLVTLHRIELMRQHLLVELEQTQADLYLHDTRHARSVDTVVGHVRKMEALADGCSSCHHDELVTRKLAGLSTRVHDYQEALSRVLTVRGNQERLLVEEEAAYRLGRELVAEANAMTTLTAIRLEQRTRAASRDIKGAKLVLFVLLGVLPFLVTGLALVLIRGFTRPIRVLVDATRRLAAGDLSHRVEGLRGEHGEVAAAFNEMARSLQQTWQKMQWAEQIVVLGELAGALAHEINNPLAGVKGAMEVIRGQPALAERNPEILEEMIHQIERIERLVRNLLDFARPPRPQLQPTDLNAVLTTTIGLAQRHPAFVATAGRTIRIDPRLAELPTILADSHQLQQAVLNLLLNAADAMPDGGTVLAETHHELTAGGVRLTITDTGAGVADPIRDKIFLPFFTTKAKGTGLGLATTKRLIEQHAGRITVENRPGQGASFSIFLPVIQ